MRYEALERLVRYMDGYALWKNTGLDGDVVGRDKRACDTSMKHYINMVCIHAGESVPDEKMLDEVLRKSSK